MAKANHGKRGKGKKKHKPLKLRSTYEERVIQNLTDQAIPFEYEKEHFEYVLHRKYKSDLTVTCPNGGSIVVECKGILDHEEREKILAVLASNPGLSTRFFLLLQADNFLHKRSLTVMKKVKERRKLKGKLTYKDRKELYGARKKYSDWCTENNIRFAVGETIPLEWLS